MNEVSERMNEYAKGPGPRQHFRGILLFYTLSVIFGKGQFLKLFALSSKYGTQLTVHLTKSKDSSLRALRGFL